MKPLLVVGLAIVGAGSLVAVMAFRSAPTLQLHTRVHGIDLGGMTVEDAQKRLREWWDAERRNPLKLVWKNAPANAPKFKDQTPTELGVSLDDVATVAQLPTRSAVDSTRNFFHSETSEPTDFPAKFKGVPVDLTPLKADIAAAGGKPHPARVVWADHKLVRKPESGQFKLADSQLVDRVGAAINARADEVELPIEAAPKHVSDDDLAKITELVSSFTTHFPAYQANRNNNIKVASGKLNGIVLLPGERLSFNETVGERTVKSGFQEAPIYKNGKHDKGIGGGICQVSSTLYNASLFGDLKIVRHHNHSMPVAYVPLGRDATVNFGVIDLVIENNYATPIAVTSEYGHGTLTFRIFGKADPSLSVKIERTGQQDWDQETRFVSDPHLKPGQQTIVEKGSRGHRIRTYRLVYKNGVLQRREPLGESYYAPSTRIVARGPVAPTAPGSMSPGTIAPPPAPRPAG